MWITASKGGIRAGNRQKIPEGYICTVVRHWHCGTVWVILIVTPIRLVEQAKTHPNNANTGDPRLWGGRWGDRGWCYFILFFFYFFFKHGEHCTGAFRYARTKGTWGPLSNRCVHSGKQREETTMRRTSGLSLYLNLCLNESISVAVVQHTDSSWHLGFDWVSFSTIWSRGVTLYWEY